MTPEFQSEEVIKRNSGYEKWSKWQLQALKRYMLQFGYGRWSKFRQQSLRSDKLIKDKSDREMRPYANWLLYGLLKICRDQVKT